MLLALCILTTVIQGQTLDFGSPAPALPVSRWIKGKPINLDQPEKVYVIDFWATWSPMCDSTVPLLTRMKERYGDKVSVIGVAAWENSRQKIIEDVSIEKIEKYIQRRGDQMNYPVVIDDSLGSVSNIWLKPAKIFGLPQAFVVKNGKIIWYGPTLLLEWPLTQIVNGLFNDAAATYEKERRRIEQLHNHSIYGGSNVHTQAKELMKKNDFEGALKLINEKSTGDDAYLKFSILSHIDPSQASTFLSQVIANAAEDRKYSYHLNIAAGIIEAVDKLPHPDLDLAVRYLIEYYDYEPNSDIACKYLSMAYLAKEKIGESLDWKALRDTIVDFKESLSKKNYRQALETVRISESRGVWFTERLAFSKMLATAYLEPEQAVSLYQDRFSWLSSLLARNDLPSSFYSFLLAKTKEYRESHRQSVMATSLLGDAYRQRGDLDQAIALKEEALALARSSKQVSNDMIIGLYRQLDYLKLTRFNKKLDLARG